MIKKGSPGLVRRLPIIVYWGDSIFEYHYLHEYEAKIENTFTLVWGSYAVSLGVNNSKNCDRWTVPLRRPKLDFSSTMDVASEAFHKSSEN